MEERLRKIFSYISGEMTADESRLFELELDDDQKLRETLRVVKEIDEVVADDDLLGFMHKIKKAGRRYKLLSEADPDYEVTLSEILQLVKEVDEQSVEDEQAVLMDNEQLVHSYENQAESVASEGNRSIKIHSLFTVKKMLAAAAVVLFLIMTSIIFYKNFSNLSNKNIFASYYQPFEANSNNFRANGLNGHDNLINIVRLYDKSNYQEAVTQLQGIIKTNPKSTTAHFYIGISFIELGNYKKAIENLSYVITKKDNNTIIVQADWYLALCYLKTNQINSAIQKFKKIASSENYYKPMAIDILQKIE